MLKNFKYFFLFLFIVSCIEPYEFVIPAGSQALVVEAFISDKSFTETKSYPSDGRYFSVKLSYAGDVANVPTGAISGASILLINDLGEQWNYSESAEAGIYSLLDENFKAQQGIKYKLQVYPPNDSGYESDWEEMPIVETPLMGGIGFSETEAKRYKIESSEPVLKTIKGITANITLPGNTSQDRIFYRWECEPMWIYVAPLLESETEPFYRCWATDRNYLADYVLQVDRAGSYRKDLFFLETIRNERLFEDLSVLVLQYAVNEEYYSFWNEMQQQVQGGALFDAPPYNLKSNLHAIDGEKAVSGYFGVVQEQAKRWYFNVDDLSYNVQNTLKGDCLVDYGPGGPAEECEDCRFYSFGTTTTTKPTWWRQ